MKKYREKNKFKKYYDENKKILQRKKIIKNLNKDPLKKKPLKKSIEKYKLIFDEKEKIWK